MNAVAKNLQRIFLLCFLLPGGCKHVQETPTAELASDAWYDGKMILFVSDRAGESAGQCFGSIKQLGNEIRGYETSRKFTSDINDLYWYLKARVTVGDIGVLILDHDPSQFQTDRPLTKVLHEIRAKNGEVTTITINRDIGDKKARNYYLGTVGKSVIYKRMGNMAAMILNTREVQKKGVLVFHEQEQSRMVSAFGKSFMEGHGNTTNLDKPIDSIANSIDRAGAVDAAFQRKDWEDRPVWLTFSSGFLIYLRASAKQRRIEKNNRPYVHIHYGAGDMAFEFLKAGMLDIIAVENDLRQTICQKAARIGVARNKRWNIRNGEARLNEMTLGVTKDGVLSSDLVFIVPNGSPLLSSDLGVRMLTIDDYEYLMEEY